MRVLKKLLLIAAFAALLLFGAVLAVNNPEPIPVDMGFMRFESVPVPVAFAALFAAGWLFGLVCAGFALLRLMAEKRRLRRELEAAEALTARTADLAIEHAD